MLTSYQSIILNISPMRLAVVIPAIKLFSLTHLTKSVSIVCVLLLGMMMFNVDASDASDSSFFKEKKRFTTDTFTFFNGRTIPQATIGWEAYGELSAKRDNVILITHYFTGNSHAAGRYTDDGEVGYWDAIIGAGKAIDTNQFYVIAVDTLANLGVHDPNVITTGPATINPETGKPYGLQFPVITMRDQVNIQKALLSSLGIERLHAVVGASMGSMQALEWATAYPDWVNSVIAVIGAAHSDAWTTTALEHWTMPIKIDPLWQNGAYTAENPPIAGLTAALMAITQTALHPDFVNAIGEQLQYSPLETAPLQDIMADHSITQWLKGRASERAALMDANHLLYLVRACQLYMAGQESDLITGLAKLKAKVLLLPTENDLLLMPYHLELTHDALLSLDKRSQLTVLRGQYGHLNGLLTIQDAAAQIASFLSPDTQ
jgi:homoserine O-acetyltransferase